MSDRTAHIKVETGGGTVYVRRDAVVAVLPAINKSNRVEPMQSVVMIGDTALPTKHSPEAVVSMLEWDKPEPPTPVDAAQVRSEGNHGLGQIPLTQPGPFGPTTPVEELQAMIDDAAAIDEAVELAKRDKPKPQPKQQAKKAA